MKAHWSWVIGAAISIPSIIVIFSFGWMFSDNTNDRYLTSVILAVGGSIGWVVGMMLSPDSLTEKRAFSSISKNISLFVSGYMVSKADKLVDAILKPDFLLSGNHLASYRLFGFFCILILSALLTYLLRVYAFTVDGG